MLGVFPVRTLLTPLLTWAAAWGCRTSILRPLACGDHQARVRALDPLLQVLRDVGARNDIHAGALRLEILGCQHIVARWPSEGANDYDTPTTQPKGTRHVVHSPGCHRARCRSENGGEKHWFIGRDGWWDIRRHHHGEAHCAEYRPHGPNFSCDAGSRCYGDAGPGCSART